MAVTLPGPPVRFKRSSTRECFWSTCRPPFDNGKVSIIEDEEEEVKEAAQEEETIENDLHVHLLYANLRVSIGWDT